MEVDACYHLGYIKGTRGLKGELHIHLDVDQPDQYREQQVFYLHLEDSLIPYFVQYMQYTGNKVTVKFEDIESLDQARSLVGAALYLPLEELPPLSGNNYYYHELLGSQVIDTDHGKLGEIIKIYDQTPQTILGMIYRDREVLIPHADDVILGWDREQKQLNVKLPEGLLNIYLED